ncbi:MAG: RIP metalloprotease RseP [Firmicutes bacterium]|jgi:regulator of sigma E protease|nr:RIP metalloprotease RseP [Bacillota bacterium]
MDTLLAFIVVFGTIVFFHEMGHFLMAKAMGVKIYEFSLGFGPPLLRLRRNGTAYAIRILPLGGFVKLAGMDEPLEGEEEVSPSDPQNFHNKSIWQRMAIIAAGPLMNFVLATLLFIAYFSLIHVFPPIVTNVLPNSPAVRAGIQPGDRILAINGETITEVGQVTRIIRRNANRPVTLRIERDGVMMDLSAVPNDQGPGGTGLIGIGLDEQKRDPLSVAIPKGIQSTRNVTVDLVASLGRMVTGRIEPELTGPVGIFKMVGQSANQGIQYLLILAAILNINLGLLNFLPIPILDGGWLLFLILEGLRGRPLEPEHQGLAQFIGLALLILLMVFATYRDILRILPS